MAALSEEQEARPSPGEENYHALSPDAVLAALGASERGLDAEEVERRLARYGRNELPRPKRKHPLLRFLAQFNSALIYLLLAAAFGATLLGHFIDAGVILVVVLINAIVGVIQEGKAENALQAIRGMVSVEANVLRNQQRQRIPVAELVPGDIVFLAPGDRVPADLRLLQARGLRADESILTGESIAAEKHPEAIAPEAPLGDRRSMLYSGTIIATGQATGVVVATGSATEIGRISTLLSDVEELTTPLLRQINRFGTRFTLFTIAAAFFLFLFAVFLRGFDPTEALIAVVALSVGVVPEGLPAVITITLAIGVQRMAARNAIIRRLPAVETLGATSVICSDKTGTLTRNEMTARRAVVAGGKVIAKGSGYSPEGEVIFEGRASEERIQRLLLLALIRCGVLCNDAQLQQEGRDWRVLGDPMEGALITLALKAGFDSEGLREEWRRLDAIPFDAEHRFMATLNQEPSGQQLILVKGAPERLLEMCSTQAEGQGEAPLDHGFWSRHIAEAAAQGERVLGFALKHPAERLEELTMAEVENGLRFLGIVGFIDPPREEAIFAVGECRSAGIDVKMITGDHAATASAIAQQLGLGENPSVLTGQDLDRLSEEELVRKVEKISVFARTSPEHKLRIVRALQSRGAVVAMTGDGVNDAPSLKQADVGVAMGRKGTEAAKEASEMILLDDNFASIVAAVKEGRTVFDNIRKVITWTIPTNGGEALTVIAAILFNFTLPMSATHILWINMITTVTLGLVLAFEPTEPNIMERPPRSVHSGILTPLLLWRIAFVSVVFALCALGVFFYARGSGQSLELARTMVVNMIVVLEVVYLFNIRYMHMTSFTWRGAMGTTPVLIALVVVVLGQLAFTYWPVMQDLFRTEPIAFFDGVLILLIGVIAMTIFEIEKYLSRRLGFVEH